MTPPLHTEKEKTLISSNELTAGQMEVLETICTLSNTIIDIGCGPGIQSYFFYERGLSVISIDHNPSLFLYKNIIDIYTSVAEVPPQRLPVDAVFASHVLEHCPDTQSSISEWRKILHDNGYLFIALPLYSPYTVNEHYHSGWTLTQLAMWLVACGFDCHESFFKILPGFGGQVFGFGRKKEFPPTHFNIEKSLPFLPQGLVQEAGYFPSGDQFLPGDLIYFDPSQAQRTN